MVFAGTASRSATSDASALPTLFTVMVYRSISPASSTFGSPVRSVEIFWITNAGLAAIVTRVGSSSPGTVGSALPLTPGSSLTANVVLLASRSDDWLLTTVPFAREGPSVMSNWITISPPAEISRLSTSSTPVPLAPPVPLVPLTSAPAG